MEHRERLTGKVENSIKEMVIKVVKVIFVIILAIGIVFLLGYAVMYLWNWLMPDLFGLPEVGYWKALGILILAKIIFGFGGGGGHKKAKTSSKKACGPLRSDLSKWKHYEEFWEEEGETAYEAYKKRKDMERGTI